MNRADIQTFFRYTCLVMGVFFFGNGWAQEDKQKEYQLPELLIDLHNRKPNIIIREDTVIDEDTLEVYKSRLSKNIKIEDLSPISDLRIIDTYTKSVRRTLNTIMVAIGSANMYDTYLSPLEYDGFSIRVMDERMRDTYWFGGKFRKQQIIELEFANGENPARNVNEYWIKARYQLGGHYLLYQQAGLKLSAGGYWDINAGGLYNERNGNNPATGRVYTNLNLSGMASYKWKKYALRWQVDTPLAGMLFSPKYGQSYYEISLGNTVGIVNFASFHNQRALRNTITADIPFSKYILRVGYLGDWYQTKVNSIITHHYTHSLVIGFPLEGIKKNKEKTRNSYWD